MSLTHFIIQEKFWHR